MLMRADVGISEETALGGGERKACGRPEQTQALLHEKVELAAARGFGG